MSIIKWHLIGLQFVVSIITCHLELQNRRFGLCKFFMNLAQNHIHVKKPTRLNVSCWHYWSIHHSLMSYFCTLGWVLSLNNLLKQVFMKIWSLRRWKLSYLSHATIWIILLVLIWMLAIAPAIVWVDVHNTIGNIFVSFHWDPATMSQRRLIKKFVQITWNNDLNFPASFASHVSSILECEGIQFCKRLTNTSARGMRSA